MKTFLLLAFILTISACSSTPEHSRSIANDPCSDHFYPDANNYFDTVEKCKGH